MSDYPDSMPSAARIALDDWAVRPSLRDADAKSRASCIKSPAKSRGRETGIHETPSEPTKVQYLSQATAVAYRQLHVSYTVSLPSTIYISRA